jgi:hypothetical protein
MTSFIGGRSLRGLRLMNRAPDVLRRVRPAGAVERVDAPDRRIGAQHLDDAVLQRDHRRERDVLGRLGRDADLADVFLREEALGDRHEQPRRRDEREQRDEEDHDAMPQGDVERTRVGAEQRLEAALERADERARAVLLVRLVLEEAAAEQRHQRQRDERRGDDREPDDDRELVEEQPDHAGHEEDRDEDRDQRARDRDDREADLARAAQRRLERGLAVLDVAHDVLEHHDRIVDDEADRERQAEQRDVVDRVAEAPEQRDRAEQRDRQRHRRDHRRDDAAQEQEDDEDDERDRSEHRQRDVVERVADRHRTIVDRRQPHRRRQLRLEAGELGAHRIDDLDRVRVGLAVDRERDRRVAVERRRRLDGLEAVLDRRDFLQPHRVAALVADDQLGELGGVAQLPVGLQRQRLRRALERADRRVGVGGAERLGQLVEADVARGERIGLDADANGERFCPKMPTCATPSSVDSVGEIRCSA